MRKTLTFTGAALSSLHGSLQDQSTSVLDANISALAERDASYAVTLSAPLNVNMENMYAGHRSHSSHSSHRSHSSHYSGSGSSYSPPTAPRPVYTPPPAPRPTYTPSPAPRTTYTPPSTYRPSTASEPSTYQPGTPKSSSVPSKPWRNYGTQQSLEPSRSPRPSTDQLQLMIMRVQAALYSKGYDPGAIDGVLGATTKSALSSFQTDHGLVSSGAMTTETLNALGVSLRP